MNIGNLIVGPGEPTAIVCEMSNAHNGSLERAHRIIDAVKAANVSALKMQAYRPSEIVALRGDGPAPSPWDGQTMLDLYTRAQTPLEWFPELVAHCNEIQLPWFSSFFGAESLALLESLSCPAFKIAALDVDNPVLRPLALGLVNRGAAVISSVRNSWGKAFGSLRLVCKEGYPQSPPFFSRDDFICAGEDRELAHRNVGFSYHGTDIEVPITAATLGAVMIEAHFQLDDEPSELEANVSLDEYQFAELTRRVREVETMLA